MPWSVPPCQFQVLPALSFDLFFGLGSQDGIGFAPESADISILITPQPLCLVIEVNACYYISPQTMDFGPVVSSGVKVSVGRVLIGPAPPDLRVEILSQPG